MHLKNSGPKAVACNVSGIESSRQEEGVCRFEMIVDALGGQYTRGNRHVIEPGQTARVVVQEFTTRPTGNFATDLHFTPGKTPVVVLCAPMFEKVKGPILAPGNPPGIRSGTVIVDVSATPATQPARWASLKDMLVGVVPDGFRSVVYAYRDPKTGRCSLMANGAILQWELKLNSRKFKFLDAWRYDPANARWERLQEPPPKAATITADPKRNVFSSLTDQVLIYLTDKTGLYWVRWLEEGKLLQMPVLCGPIMPQDYSVAPPPKGMVIAGIPYEDRAEVKYIPDPRPFFAANPPGARKAPSGAEPKAGK